VSGVFAIGDAATVRGFELAGFRGIVAETGAAVRAAVARARAEGARLAVLCEPAAALAPELVTDASGAASPLLVVVPALAGEGAPTGGQRVRSAVRRALGVPEGRRG
jgi:vacuolar-type H+-ATPase subunit F/Vma7